MTQNKTQIIFWSFYNRSSLTNTLQAQNHIAQWYNKIMIEFGNFPFCSIHDLVIPLEKKDKTLICSCCKSTY